MGERPSKYDEKVGLDGARVRDLRERARLSQLSLAERIGVARGYISTIETQPDARPRLRVARLLASTLGVPLEEILAQPEPATAVVTAAVSKGPRTLRRAPVPTSGNAADTIAQLRSNLQRSAELLDRLEAQLKLR